MPSIPYVVGQWVRGEKFYGRSDQVAEVLSGNRNWLWLLGTRRIGKTSLLKQLEHITTASPEKGYFPIFWDFQGAEDPGELHLDFGDALLDAEERLGEIGIDLEDVAADDLFVSLARLRRQLRTRKLRLLLLCDEVEELIKLHQKEPALLRKLRRALQSQEDIRSVLASTIRLWALADHKEDTSPFLHGFAPPLYIRALVDEEAESLIRQANLAPGARPSFKGHEVETIRTRCDNHPYLIQLVCKRFLETEDLEEAIEQVATDRMVSYFFSVDFEMLAREERNILRIIGEQSAATSQTIRESLPLEPSSIDGSLHRLENLGFIRRNRERQYVLENYFFRRWLKEVPRQELSPEPTARDARSQLTTAALDQNLGLIDGRYELLEQVGEGATGLVFLAHDRLLDVKIAIKVLKPQFAFNETVLERFRQEIVLSRDIGHPNILRAYHLGEFEGERYLTMQWVDGPTLSQLIAKEAPLTASLVVSIAQKLSSALEAAHARKVIHRDIKPQNILLDQSREPFITDFGLARVVGGPGITDTGMFLGTPFYASPEQATFLPLDERSDLYSLGVVVFEMATGRRPFVADSTAEVLEMQRSAPPPDPRDVESSVSPELSRLILRCLEKVPDKRPESAATLRASLVALASFP